MFPRIILSRIPKEGIGLQLPLLCMVRGTAFPALAFPSRLRLPSLAVLFPDTGGHKRTRDDTRIRSGCMLSYICL